MHSTKTITLNIYKDEDSYLLSDEERQKILLKLASEVFEIAERFDGCCKIIIRIFIEGKGNC